MPDFPIWPQCNIACVFCSNPVEGFRHTTDKYAYEELKGELGLDHFEGRSFPGWHHHISVVLSCYAFVAAERSQHFPPSAGRKEDPRALDRAA